MRIAVLSDVHSNLQALDAVLDRARAERATAMYVLGDIVGYGANPNEVIRTLGNEQSSFLIAGNHDLAATARFDTTWFNSVAEDAIRWTERTLSTEARELLGSLQPRGVAEEALLVHGSVRDPAAEYVLNADVAAKSFDAEEFALCFFGHTHMPTVFSRTAEGKIIGSVLEDGVAISVPGSKRLMLNPGSVGQPRDGDPRASFLVYDTVEQTAIVHRVPYDIARAQDTIRAAGLPGVLADRLEVGR